MFEALKKRGFDVHFQHHAKAIAGEDFPEIATEIESVLTDFQISVEEIIKGGGGESKPTQRLRKGFNKIGWKKRNLKVEKIIDDKTTQSLSHEIDHVKTFENGTIALEIEWNNKDPFFDRDLDNFYRLHADGGISLGIIITRGRSFDEQIEETLLEFAQGQGFKNQEDLKGFNLQPTERQKSAIKAAINREGSNRSYISVWAEKFVSDKFGKSTTNWKKLTDRLDRGVGNPCPLIAIGIPINVVKAGT
ncbi:MAG: restriction endonuclease [Alphaproteobacteria bacterium]|nr:restriction endonuclease [Alphaproteobacteria bacterium]